MGIVWLQQPTLLGSDQKKKEKKKKEEEEKKGVILLFQQSTLHGSTKNLNSYNMILIW